MGGMIKGSDAGLLTCPHCGKEVYLRICLKEAHIVCSDPDCWGLMSVRWGNDDEPWRFIGKMKASWNRRTKESHAIVEAKRYIEEYREQIYAETQQEYDEHGGCCVDVLDEVIHKLDCFMPSGDFPVVRRMSYDCGENRWISVDERLPTEADANLENCVLAVHRGAPMRQYFHWRSVAENPFDFTHWMKPPEPPR